MSKKSFLDSIQSPSPCSADWNKMLGDERVRFCYGCEKNVYNLSAMPRGEARKFVAKNAGKICVRYVRLPDGKVQTANTKFYKIGGRVSRLTAGVFGAALTLSTMALNAQTETPSSKSQPQKTEAKQNTDYSKTSRISFTVYDPIDAIVPNEAVELINQKTKEEFTVLTNQEGIANFSLLPRGRYDLNVSGNGFNKYQATIQIKEPIEPNVKIRLDVVAAVGVFVVDWSEIPLFRAIAQEDNETVKQLINAGFDVKTKDNEGETALHVAVEHGNLEIVKFLLDKGARVNVKDKEKRTPLAMFFAGAGGTNDEDKAMEIIRLLASKGADVNIRDEDGETFLMKACEDESLEDVKFLLELGVNPNFKDDDGETAFDKTDSEEIKRLLIRYGAGKSEN